MFLTNSARSLHNTAITEIGISDYHKLINSFFRSNFEGIPPKNVEYRNYKKFNVTNFLRDLDQEMIQGEMYKYNSDMYSTFSDIFRSVLDRHSPLKWKMIRGNQEPFMTKQLSKAIMNRCKLRNRYIKWPSKESFLDYKKAKNTCHNLSKFTKKSYFDKVTSKGFVSNKAFWTTVKPFLTSKGFLTNKNITIKHKDKIVTDNSKLAHSFNNHYINIVENTSEMPPKIFGNPECKSDDHLTVEKIVKHYKNHQSIEKINKICNKKENFDIPTTTTEEINKIIKELGPKKATGLDKIPPKIVKMSANVIDSRSANIINNDITKNVFSEKAKVASVRPVFKKNEPEKT